MKKYFIVSIVTLAVIFIANSVMAQTSGCYRVYNQTTGKYGEECPGGINPNPSPVYITPEKISEVENSSVYRIADIKYGSVCYFVQTVNKGVKSGITQLSCIK